MKRWISGLLACMAALALAACGGSDEDEAAASPQALCNSIGTQPKIVNLSLIHI